MDTSEYMPMFLAEAREHLQELNLAIVALEEDPSDRETVDGIFRIAHSFKGMSATMGFSAVAELTHVMEDAFELLRQRNAALAPDAISTVLACLDALEGAVDSIEETGQEDLDPASLIDQLHTLIRNRTEEQALERAGGAKIPTAAQITSARDQGLRILHVIAELRPDAMMPAVRAHMIFTSVTEHGEFLGSVPDVEVVENFEGTTVHAWIASDHHPDELRDAAASIGDVGEVSVEDLTDIDAVDEEHLVPNAESAQPQPVPVATNPAPAEPDAPEVDDKTPGAEPAAAAERKSGASHSSSQTVRVDAERLDALMHLMGELVIHRTAVEALTAGVDSPSLQMAVQDLTRSSQALQQMVMNVRMIPVDVVFMRFPRLVRDLSNKLGKDVELELLGRDTELDRTVVDSLGDPLVHLVRNSLDHGLESADIREAAGKPRTGKLTIQARHAGGSVVIEVRDDGRGVDPQAVAKRAVQAGLIDEDAAATLDMKGALELLFTAGFSTAVTTSDISGRGVGMDAVRAKIRSLGGEVVMDSTLGAGTSAQIRLPLTLAIVSALQVRIAGSQFAIPIERVERALRLSEQVVRSVGGRKVLSVQDGVLPLLPGAETFGRVPSGTEDLIVIVRGEDRRIGLIVDDLVGQRELVTRPLPSVAAESQPVSGGAVLADGQIALIIDCDALSQHVSNPPPTAGGSPPPRIGLPQTTVTNSELELATA